MPSALPPSRPMLVAIASKNPNKVQAVIEAIDHYYPGSTAVCKGLDIPSGVSEQPLFERETQYGAFYRAQQALDKEPRARYGVGIEGGIATFGSSYFECGWVCVLGSDGREGVASTVRIPLPTAFAKKMRRTGQTLNDICKQYFDVNDAGIREGYYGVVTRLGITRLGAYRDAVIAALVPHIYPQHF